MFKLRPYQQDAIDKLVWSASLVGNDICVLPTGAGKSLIIAELAHKLACPVLIIQPSKEILEQNISKMSHYVDNDEIGVYSASMNRKDISTYTFATIQSIYKKPEFFNHFKYIIIDECHLVNPKNLHGMFSKFLKSIGSPKVFGLTATPYRLDTTYEKTSYGFFIARTATKLINRMKGNFWNRIIYTISTQELVDAGYLQGLRYIDKSLIDHKEIPLNVSKSDFDLKKFEDRIAGDEQKILEAVFFAQEICKHVLVFCSSVEQAERLKTMIPDSEVVTSATTPKVRQQVVQDFREGKIQTVFNVGVLTTGFDFPELDGIVLIRPTRSIGLYSQMLGRGVRIAPGKSSCKVIDLTSTVKNIGKIESIRIGKIDGKWDIISDKGCWHNKVLYSFEIIKE